MKLVSIDFEFHDTAEPILNVVCCSLLVEGKTENYWTYYCDEGKAKLVSRLNDLNEQGYIFLAFNVDAEAGSFISLGLKHEKFKWIDLQVEWKMVCNQNHEFEYGNHLIKGKKVKTSPPLNKWNYTKEEIERYQETHNSSPPPKNLAGCVYFLLGVVLDKGVRDIIIRANREEIEENKKIIMDYCADDVQYLKPALAKIASFYKKKGILSKDELLWRGETVARVAKMTRLGYPVNRDWVVNLTKNVGLLELEIIEDINSQFPDNPPFVLKRKNVETPTVKDYQLRQRTIKDYIKSQPYADKWDKSAPTKMFPEGQYSLATEVIEKFWNYKHDYPQGNLGAQFMRYKHFIKSMSGFRTPKSPTKDTEYLIDFVGSDDRCRAYLNPYGSQTSRYQPKAAQFIFLKSAWTRGIVQPRPGKMIVGMDYASQEFLLQGLLSKDKAMLKAYKSGDVYLYFAKLAGAVPWDGTKEKYSKERNLFKAVTLAMGYGMGAKSLAVNLSQRLGKEVSEEEGQEYKELFMQAYPNYANFSKDLKYITYPEDEMLRLSDGWTMFGDNINSLSVGNFPLQGCGAEIARRAIALCQDAGIDVLFPLHDALYCEVEINDWGSVDTIHDKMIEACGYPFKEPLSTIATQLMRLDPVAWGSELEEGEVKTPKGRSVETKNIYIDPRGKSEYEKFKKYFQS